MTEKPALSVVAPCFNEEGVLPAFLSRVGAVLDRLGGTSEIVVVDDGSRDGTAQEVELRFADEPRVRLLRQPNGGKASALNRAIHDARGEILVGLDADTQIAPDCISLLVE